MGRAQGAGKAASRLTGLHKRAQAQPSQQHFLLTFRNDNGQECFSSCRANSRHEAIEAGLANARATPTLRFVGCRLSTED
jgi:hypothetical protein